MPNLQNVDISNNEIVELPEIDSTCQFRSFDISNNKLTKLPNSINHLKGLSRFTLKNNKLTTIPTGIGSITRLNTLDLTNNPLESLPVKELRKLQDLRQLFIMEKPEPTQEK
jgi:Leucine-rich repeat (LRR) protein